MIWSLANNGNTYNYLIRPRRFGKSVLVDTLQAYFEGKKELFEGLKIMELEKSWVKRPVIRLDMSRAGATAEEISSYLNRAFKKLEKLYQITIDPQDSLANRFDAIIETSDVAGGGAELFLYQSGYLTIKGYSNGVYDLGKGLIDWKEVEEA